MRQEKNDRRAMTLLELVVVLIILVIVAAIVVPLISSTPDDARIVVTQATMKSLRDAILAYRQDMKGISVGTADTTGVPRTLKDLQVQPEGAPLFDPTTRRGWRGPYLMQATGSFVFTNPDGTPHLDATLKGYGNEGEIAFLDGWGTPIVLQWPSVGQGSSTDATQDLLIRIQNIRLVSAGSPTNGRLGVLDTVKLTGGVLPLMPTMPTTAQPQLQDMRGNDLVLFILTQDHYP